MTKVNRIMGQKWLCLYKGHAAANQQSTVLLAIQYTNNSNIKSLKSNKTDLLMSQRLFMSEIYKF